MSDLELENSPEARPPSGQEKKRWRERLWRFVLSHKTLSILAGSFVTIAGSFFAFLGTDNAYRLASLLFNAGESAVYNSTRTRPDICPPESAWVLGRAAIFMERMRAWRTTVYIFSYDERFLCRIAHHHRLDAPEHTSVLFPVEGAPNSIRALEQAKSGYIIHRAADNPDQRLAERMLDHGIFMVAFAAIEDGRLIRGALTWSYSPHDWNETMQDFVKDNEGEIHLARREIGIKINRNYRRGQKIWQEQNGRRP